jgi:hypothetical protein
MKSKKRRELVNLQAVARAHRAENPGEKSNYAKKRIFLRRAGGHGFDYPDRPWK